MSKNTSRMIGMIAMIISIFFLIGGLYLDQTGISHTVTTVSLVLGVILLITGTVFYKILKTD